MSTPETVTKDVETHAQYIRVAGFCRDQTATTLVAAGDPRVAERLFGEMADSIELTCDQSFDFQKETRGHYRAEFSAECVRVLELDVGATEVTVVIEGSHEAVDRLHEELTESMVRSAAARIATDPPADEDNGSTPP